MASGHDTSTLALVQASLLGEAIDAGPALVFVADETMKYIAVNRYACELLGYTREELLSLHVTDVVRSDEAPAEFQEMVARGARTGTAELACKDGSTLTLEYRAQTTKVARIEFYVSVGWIVD